MTSLAATYGAEVVTYVLVKGDMKVTNLLQAEFNPKRPIRGTIWLLDPLHVLHDLRHSI